MQDTAVGLCECDSSRGQVPERRKGYTRIAAKQHDVSLLSVSTCMVSECAQFVCDHGYALLAALTTLLHKQISASLLFVAANCYSKKCVFSLTACNADCISCSQLVSTLALSARHVYRTHSPECLLESCKLYSHILSAYATIA